MVIYQKSGVIHQYSLIVSLILETYHCGYLQYLVMDYHKTAFCITSILSLLSSEWQSQMIQDCMVCHCRSWVQNCALVCLLWAIKKLLKNHAKSWENIQKNSLKLILTFNKVYINLSKGKHNELHITQWWSNQTG